MIESWGEVTDCTVQYYCTVQEPLRYSPVVRAYVQYSTVSYAMCGSFANILETFSCWQSRRPGMGVRLFVQACVLAGCDYCPNKLNRVGLITAFKLIRDNANQEPGERFQKILSSLSREARSKINDEKYEELLTKSEAVFYYHPVLDLKSGNITPLLSPLTSKENNTLLIHYPSHHRIVGDFSFLHELPSHDVRQYSPPVTMDGLEYKKVTKTEKRRRQKERKKKEKKERESFMALHESERFRILRIEYERQLDIVAKRQEKRIQKRKMSRQRRREKRMELDINV